jgi:putative transposase
MPWGLKRFQASGQTHFVTFCCYHRRPSFTTAIPRQVFEAALERVRLSFELCVHGYVVMPEHVHLLLSEPQQQTLADAIKSLKQGVSRRLIGEAEHFWQKRYYDFNVRNEPQFVEKLRYIHQNPVKRGLCARAEDWEWGSFRRYATGCAGRVEIECRVPRSLRLYRKGRALASRRLSHLHPQNAAIVDLYQPNLTEGVASKTAPAPLLRLDDQPAFHGILVHVA